MSEKHVNCLVDGRPADSVPCDDRGLLYGDHLFETLAVRDGRVPLWDWHWRRLNRGCDVLGLIPPDPDAVRSECRELCPAGTTMIIRMTLTRGSGGQAYFPLTSPRCRRILSARPWPDAIGQQRLHGLDAMICPIRLASQPVLAGLKHGNRLEQVLIARACASSGVDEALVFDQQGWLVEGLMSNLVLETRAGLVTPEAQSGVRGVGLDWLMDRADCAISQVALSLADVGAARSIMMINSVAGVRPVIALDGRKLAISDQCRRLQQLWNDLLI